MTNEHNMSKEATDSLARLNLAIQKYLIAKRKYLDKMAELKAFLEECKH